MKVLISGAGIGGLSLAQALRKAGVHVSVYERDASADIRGQGYRFRIDSHGDSALKQCLPQNLYQLYRATSNLPSKPPSRAFDHRLNAIYEIPRDPSAPPPPVHTAVNRLTLRQVMLGGLTDCVHFNHAVAAAEQNRTGVRLHFANGETAEGDTLVAADGINSPIRQQLLPHAEIFDCGMRCIYGRTPIDALAQGGIPEPLFDGLAVFVGPDRCTLAAGMFRSRRPFAEAVSEFAPEVKLDPVDGYLMWMLVYPETAPRPNTETWHPDLRRLIELADMPSTFQMPIRSSRPLPPWPATNITFLGDAIHAMTPAGGMGANTAFRDAALLGRLLGAVNRGELELRSAIEQYESEIRGYAFAAVEQSLQAAVHLYRIQIPNSEAPA